MLDVRFRERIDKIFRPIGRVLARAGLTANRLTITGVILNLVAAGFVATGRFIFGAILGGVGSVIDMLDGATAKAGQATSRRGAFLDSVADRVSEVAVFSALAWHFSHSAESVLAVLAVLTLGFSLLISYERARAESLGLDGKTGLFERGERLIVLGVGLFIPHAMPLAMWVLAIGTAFTAIQRFVYIWRQAEPAPRPIGVTPYRMGAARIRRREAALAAKGLEDDEAEADGDVREAKVFTAFVPRRMRERLGERAQRRPPSSARRKRARGA